MEFQYRAGNERSRSPPPPTGAVAAPANSGSADCRGGDGAGDHGENWAAVPRPPPADPDEVRRQVAKDRIRERILREEAEHWALEAEVRRELMEQLFPLLRSRSARSTGAGAEGSDAMAAPAGMTADLQSPIVLEPMQIGSKANASAALPAKRKNPEFTAASAVSAATSGKKQKPDLTCTVCGVTATGMKAMQDHLKGKGHRKKAAALVQPMPEAEHGQHEQQQQQQEGVVTPPSGKFTPSKLTMLTNAGAMNEVLQMDGYLLCEVCNVRAADRVTMMCHLEGTKHTSKAQKQRQAGKPAAVGGTAAAKKNGKGRSSQAVAGCDPETAVVAVDGVPRTVRLVDGFFFCECCHVKVPSESIMQSHLAGKKHKKKAKVSLAQAKAKDVTSVAGATLAEVASASGTLHAKAADASVSVALKLVDGTAEIEEVTAVAAKVGEHVELQETGAMAEDVATNVDIISTPGQDMKKVDAPAAVAVTAGGSESVVVDVDGVHVQQVVQRVDGFLHCASCNVKAPSDCIMRSHLNGKKHKNKVVKVAAVHDGEVVKEGAPAQAKPKGPSVVTGTGNTQGNGSVKGQVAEEVVVAPLATQQGDAACAGVSVAPMEVDEPAKLEDVAAIAEEENAAAEVNSLETQGEESVKADGIAAPAQEVKIQVEGKMCTVLRQANGTLSCEPCGVHCRDKDGMLLHLYTRAHWDNVPLDVQKEQVAPAPAVAKEDGDGSNPVTEGTAQVEN